MNDKSNEYFDKIIADALVNITESSWDETTGHFLGYIIRSQVPFLKKLFDAGREYERRV